MYDNRDHHDLRPANFDPDRPWRLFIISSVEGDYLVVNPVNGDGSTNTKRTRYVLKPWTLRRTPFDGKTVNSVSYTYIDNATRTATGSATETQLITQDYFAGAQIYARPIQPKVKLTAGAGSGKYTGLLDVNVDARAWAVQ